jgi:acetyltransferase-like isoleucine patch superfamily enzyme
MGYRSGIRPLLVQAARFVAGQRPMGLASLGKSSFVERPQRLIARGSIRIGHGTQILAHSVMMPIRKYLGQRFTPEIEIGNDVYIGRYVYFTACQKIVIGDGCVLSECVYISDLTHGFDPRGGLIARQPLASKGPVEIGANCFLGYRVTVMPGVKLGEWCIVGAHSVVTRSFPAYSMIAGAPARLLKVYSPDSQEWKLPDADIEEKIKEC